MQAALALIRKSCVMAKISQALAPPFLTYFAFFPRKILHAFSLSSHRADLVLIESSYLRRHGMVVAFLFALALR